MYLSLKGSAFSLFHIAIETNVKRRNVKDFSRRFCGHLWEKGKNAHLCDLNTINHLTCRRRLFKPVRGQSVNHLTNQT